MRNLVFLLLAVAATGSVADYLAWRASHRGLSALAAQAGLFGPLPDLEVELRRETEPARAATLVAWGLLDLEVDRTWLAELPASERQAQADQGIDRLRQARRLVEETLPRRPASWQAAMVLGVTRYLQAERAGERRQPTSVWRRPLLAAMDLAPGHPEPPLFLASASLSRWSSLSAAERDGTRPVLARALQEPTGLELLIRPWVRLAPSMDRLLEVIPDHPDAWRKLGQVFRAAGDLERLGTAHQRWLDSQPVYLANQVRQARDRRRGGARASAFAFARRVAAAPADLAFVEQFSEALAILPDDFETPRTDQDLRRWLLWALDLCLLGHCPLEAAAISRLAGFVDDLHPAQAALAALVAGNLAAVASLEVEAVQAAESEPEWHRYWVHKANQLATDDPDSARRALERTSPTGRADPLYWRVRERLAELAGDKQALTQARRELNRPAGSGWTAADWRPRGASHRLVLFSPGRSQGFRLGLAGVPETGAALELRWDGRSLGVASVQRGEEVVWRLPVESGLHQLEVASLSGRAPRPGALSLDAASPPG